MQIVMDTQTTEDPNLFGEILRDFSFQESYGCYSCFDLIDGFEPVSKDSPLGIIMLGALGLIDEEDEQEREIARIYKKGYILIAWHWSGDGVLAIAEGERCAVNRDCKKSDGWQWQEM